MRGRPLLVSALLCMLLRASLGHAQRFVAGPHLATAAGNAAAAALGGSRSDTCSGPVHRGGRRHHGSMTLTRSRGDGNGGDGVVIQPADNKYGNVVVWMHGLGDTADFILPTAPVRPITLNGGFRMPGWSDILALSADAQEDRAGLDESAARVQALLDAEKAKGIPASRMVVAGFSQGGAVALHLALRAKERLGGCVACSGWLPLASDYPTALGEGARAGTPVLQCHGDSDVVVQHAYGLKSHNAIKEMGVPADFVTYRGMGHSACEEELQKVSDFIRKQFQHAQS